MIEGDKNVSSTSPGSETGVKGSWIRAHNRGHLETSHRFMRLKMSQNLDTLRGKPTSSRASRRAVAFRSSSSASTFPPGKAIWPG